MAYDPERHHRRSLRLADYDYTQNGAYYVTICTHERECLFGEIDGDGGLHLNEYGEIVQDCWAAIPHHFPQADIDAFVVMPNHVHGIVVIAEGNVGAQHAAPVQYPDVPLRPAAPLRHAAPLQYHAAPLRLGTPGQHQMPLSNVAAGSLGAIIRSFKSAAARQINILRATPSLPVWHRNYHERIVRDEHRLNNARRYIENNPARWSEDVNNPAKVTQTYTPSP